MSAADALRREASTFARLIAGVEPPGPAVDAYLRAHERRGDLGRGDAFQTRLVADASKSVFRARTADGYARLFDPHGPLRRKLVLMLAILECTPPVHRRLDAPPASGLLASLVLLKLYGLRAAACAALGVVRFEPARRRAARSAR